MKQYTLQVIVDGQIVTFDRKFSSREEALNYAFSYFDKKDQVYFVINDEYCINDDKHNREYVSDYANRFRIARA